MHKALTIEMENDNRSMVGTYQVLAELMGREEKVRMVFLILEANAPFQEVVNLVKQEYTYNDLVVLKIPDRDYQYALKEELNKLGMQVYIPKEYQ
jgi:hypothetical protein